MKRIFIVFGFFHSLYAKPILDLHDSNLTKDHKFCYERPNFIWATYGKNSDVIVLTDSYLKKAKKSRENGYKTIIAYILEPRIINAKPYEYVLQNPLEFDLIFTFDHDLLQKFPKRCKFVHAPGSSSLHNHAIHPKSKLCSIITGKNWTEGHRLRHLALEKYRDVFDGIKTDQTPRVPWKDPWLNDFCFSVVTENSKVDYYFTEKLIDCFRSGTIPIYWGCPSIGKFFDTEGIITFDTLEELGEILQNLSYEEYEKRLSFIRKNFELAAKFPQSNLIIRPDLPDAMDSIWDSIQLYLKK